MAMTPGDYYQQLLQLFPPGIKPGPNLRAFLEGVAQEYARIEARLDDLRNELDPRTTSELLDDWEAFAALPSKCMAGQSQTVAERRASLVGKIAHRGGQSPAYFIALAASLGYTITIDEFYDPDPYKWRVNSGATTVRHFKAGSRAGEPLRTWGNTLLECAITEDKPAHTTVAFAYV